MKSHITDITDRSANAAETHSHETRRGLVSLRGRREERNRERRRMLVKSATVREHSGRGWERDHTPVRSVFPVGNGNRWEPVG